MGNLTLLCRYHHHLVHEGQHRLTREPDGAIAVHRPDGSHLATAIPHGHHTPLTTPTTRFRPLTHPPRTPIEQLEHQVCQALLEAASHRSTRRPHGPPRTRPDDPRRGPPTRE